MQKSHISIYSSNKKGCIAIKNIILFSIKAATVTYLIIIIIGISSHDNAFSWHRYISRLEDNI
jgi:hypothetical protein